jgi:hypothetical protein
MSSRCCLRYSAHAFSSARVWSFEAIPNRPNANIKARTLTWGSAARPVDPHLRQVMIGVWMLRPVRIRCSIPSSSSRKLMSVGIDTRSCHFERNRTTISGNQVRCASPDGIFGNLVINCPFSTFGLRHCSRAASSELDIGCESKPRNYSRDIAGALPGKHRIGQVTTDVKGEHTRADITSCWPTTRPVCAALGDCVEGARYSERLGQLTGR